MKIREWMKKYVPSFKRGAWTAKVPEDQYVIRECEFCSHFNEIDWETCENRDSLNYRKTVSDGCIYFKEK